MFADIFGETDCDINVTVLEPNALCAWHRHQKQDDQFFVLQGTVKFGALEGSDGFVNFTTTSERNPQLVYIPAGKWHGYKNMGPGQAIILMRLSRKYDPSDEERLSVKEAYEQYGASWDRHAR